MDDPLLSVFNLPIVTLQYKNVVFGPGDFKRTLEKLVNPELLGEWFTNFSKA